MVHAWCIVKPCVKTRGLFLQGPKTFFALESQHKISNLMITELFYMFLHTRSFRRINLFAFRYTSSENGFAGPKSSQGFQETGPRSHGTESAILGCKLCSGISKTKKIKLDLSKFLCFVIPTEVQIKTACMLGISHG